MENAYFGPCLVAFLTSAGGFYCYYFIVNRVLDNGYASMQSAFILGKILWMLYVFAYSICANIIVLGILDGEEYIGLAMAITAMPTMLFCFILILASLVLLVDKVFPHESTDIDIEQLVERRSGWICIGLIVIATTFLCLVLYK